MRALHLVLVVALLPGFTVRASTEAEVKIRPQCMENGLGHWADQAVEGDGLASPELVYTNISLASAWGHTLAVLDALNQPVLLPEHASKCGCCRLCFGQNSLTGAFPLVCKRWSFHAGERRCRLFGPGGEGFRAVTLQNVDASDQEWFSGSTERSLALRQPEPEGQCAVLSHGGLLGGSTGGGSVRNPPSSPPASPPPAMRQQPPADIRRSPPNNRKPPTKTQTRSPPPKAPAVRPRPGKQPPPWSQGRRTTRRALRLAA